MALFHAAGARAEGYPSRTIQMVLPFTPGNVADMVGRTLSSLMAKELGQPVVVENIGGGAA